jgi:hypothetical protein
LAALGRFKNSVVVEAPTIEIPLLKPTVEIPLLKPKVEIPLLKPKTESYFIKRSFSSGGNKIITFTNTSVTCN